jgi:hypothetical protein
MRRSVAKLQAVGDSGRAAGGDFGAGLLCVGCVVGWKREVLKKITRCRSNSLCCTDHFFVESRLGPTNLEQNDSAFEWRAHASKANRS